jgi:hypothetical protein
MAPLGPGVKRPRSPSASVLSPIRARCAGGDMARFELRGLAIPLTWGAEWWLAKCQPIQALGVGERRVPVSGFWEH